MTTRNAHVRRAAALAIFFAAACGGNGAITNLKAVFFRTVTTAPVASLTFKLQGGAAMDKASARYDTRPLFDGWLKVGPSTTANANSSGVASIALTPGTYPLRIQSHVPASTALVGDLYDTFSISADTSKTYQTSQQSWTVTSQKAFSALEIAVYQVDGNGRAMVGDSVTSLNPIVLDASPAVPGGNATSLTFTTELFKGSYRAVVRAIPVTSTDNIAPFETAAFNAAGGGAAETQTVSLVSGGNVVSLHFMEAGAALADSQIGRVDAYDAGSLVYLGSGESSGGVATVSTGAVSNVIAVVLSPDDEVMAAAAYAASPTHSATLTRFGVGGHVKAPGGASLAGVTNNSYGTVKATLNSGLGAFWDQQLTQAVQAKITDALGTYQLKLLAGSYSVQAVSLKNLPNSAPVAVNVSADNAAQDVPVDAGGVVAGTIQDEAHANVPGVTVALVDANHKTVGITSTDANGTWSLAVPFGTYELFAAGALTRDVSVSSGASTKTLNLTRFQITGRLIDASQGPVAGKIFWGGGNATAGSLGTFTINVVQGLNWFLFTGPSTSPSLGFAYETNVLVDANTVKSLQQ